MHEHPHPGGVAGRPERRVGPRVTGRGGPAPRVADEDLDRLGADGRGVGEGSRDQPLADPDVGADRVAQVVEAHRRNPTVRPAGSPNRGGPTDRPGSDDALFTVGRNGPSRCTTEPGREWSSDVIEDRPATGGGWAGPQLSAYIRERDDHDVLVHHTFARTFTVVGAAAALTVGGSAGAFAHECYVASRSAQGNAMAGTHSQAWETYTVQQVVTLFLGQSASRRRLRGRGGAGRRRADVVRVRRQAGAGAGRRDRREQPEHERQGPVLQRHRDRPRRGRVRRCHRRPDHRVRRQRGG